MEKMCWIKGCMKLKRRHVIKLKVTVFMTFSMVKNRQRSKVTGRECSCAWIKGDSRRGRKIARIRDRTVQEKGKLVPARRMEHVSLCLNKCKERLMLCLEGREDLFGWYWAMADFNKGPAYICSSVAIKATEENRKCRLRKSSLPVYYCVPPHMARGT
jgi:hypothetical protein